MCCLLHRILYSVRTSFNNSLLYPEPNPLEKLMHIVLVVPPSVSSNARSLFFAHWILSLLNADF